MEGKYLITTDNWFYAPDGQQYRAVWGEVQVLGDNVLGIKTNEKSTNWYAKVGSEDRHVVVAGCQIHYAVRCEDPPSMQHSTVEEVVNGELKMFQYLTRIYNAETYEAI